MKVTRWFGAAPLRYIVVEWCELMQQRYEFCNCRRVNIFNLCIQRITPRLQRIILIDPCRVLFFIGHLFVPGLKTRQQALKAVGLSSFRASVDTTLPRTTICTSQIECAGQCHLRANRVAQKMRWLGIDGLLDRKNIITAQLCCLDKLKMRLEQFTIFFMYGHITHYKLIVPYHKRPQRGTPSKKGSHTIYDSKPVAVEDIINEQNSEWTKN